ncbi:MAG: peptidoglycan-binding domain-containing protein, partial [Acidobacteriota bacterium]
LDDVRAGDGTISQGARTPAVREIQTLLAQAGIQVAVDGDFGRGTKAAVEQFQRASGLDVDGIVGRNTLAALEAAANGG